MGDKDDNMDLMTILSTFSLVGVSIGFIVGMSAHKLVRSISEKVIMPLLSSLLRVNNLHDASVTLNGNKIEYGEVILTLIDIGMVLLLIYLLLVYVLKPYILKLKRDQEKPEKTRFEQAEEMITQLTSINDQSKSIEQILKDSEENNSSINTNVV
jgi:large-conductance mechanosensitive channel